MRKILSGVVWIACLCRFVLPSAIASEGNGGKFAERVKSVAVVEFFVQLDIERQPQLAIGVVFDDEGRILLLENSVPSWIPPERFKDFKVKSLGENSDGYEAEYLGQDYLTGNHYIQMEEAARSAFTPVTRFGQGHPAVGERVWGIGLMNKNWDYKAYYLEGRLSMEHDLPWAVGFVDSAVAYPGSIAFNAAGEFVGWGLAPSSEEYTFFIGGDRYNGGLQSRRETKLFLMAEPFFKYLDRIPAKKEGDAKPWIGVTGMQPIDREVSKFLGLENQGALVLSDIIEGGPADEAGLKGKDIVVAVNGVRLKKFRPDFVINRHFENKIMLSGIAQEILITVVRGEEEVELTLVPREQPTPLKRAERQYFDKLGVTLREFTLFDAVSRRILKTTFEGVVADFVKPNSPVNAGDLQNGDWIKEIDGQAIISYEQSVQLLESIEADENRDDFVMLISRNNETKVIRVKLK